MGYETVTDTLADAIPGYCSLVQDINVTPVLAQPAVRQLLAWFNARTSQPARLRIPGLGKGWRCYTPESRLRAAAFSAAVMLASSGRMRVRSPLVSA